MSASVYINDKYKSSVRIDTVDDNYEAFLDSVIVHGTLSATLTTISRELVGSSQRAFTVTGPYGSGKSTLAALVSGTLDGNLPKRDATLSKFANEEALLKSLTAAFPYSKGWGVVKHVCGLNSPAQAITKSIYEYLGEDSLAQVASLSEADCLIAIEDVISKASQALDGIVLLVDELGKALDYQSNHDGDLYFFQELADIAQKLSTPFIIVGFLHQAFSQYARGKTALVQQEWAKVQGRYRDLSYNPTIDESLILIADSIRLEASVERDLIERYQHLVSSVTEVLPKASSTLDSLISALPIDPLVSLLLGPISRRRFSQNERSIFGFLASSERYGFRWFTENEWSPEALPLYGPELLWQYLNSNLGHLIASSPDGKAWLEAQDALHRAENTLSELNRQVALVVALLSMFGQSFQLFATRELIHSYFVNFGHTESKVKASIAELESSGILIFRQKHNALFIFQGSDIDINALIASEVDSIKDGINWASECATPSHILASSHYHRTGAMRWATTTFIETPSDVTALKQSEMPKAGEPFSSFVLIGEALKKAELKTLSLDNPALMIGCPQTTNKLKQAAIEAIAISKIFKREDRLAHDHVALQELNNRLADAKQRLSHELDALFNSTSWFYRGNALGVAPLSKLASIAADTVFSESPCIINELVNRSKPSGNANSATNKLMLAMLQKDRESDLGFDENSFPPEKGIYLSVLKSKGWHQETSVGTGFIAEWTPTLMHEFPEAYRLWESGFDYIRSADGMVVLSDLYEMWMRPPFGLTTGLCRVYALALLKSLEGKVAFYDKDSTQSFIFIPQLDEVIVEKLHKHAHEVAVRYFEIDSVQTHVVRSIAEAAELQVKDDSNVLELAKHIVKQVHTLPPWVKKTSGRLFEDDKKGVELSAEAKALRNSALRANDPYKLILDDIPAIFKLKQNGESSPESIERLSTRLKAALDELVSQHTLLIDAFKRIVLQELEGSFNEELVSRCEKVAKSAHRPSIKEFATRLAAFIKNQGTFEWVASTALGAADRNWTDKHISNGLHEIYNLCRQFRREETFTKLSSNVAARSVGLITSDSNGHLTELEGYISSTTVNDPRVEKIINSLSEGLEDLPNDLKREVLVKLLSDLMLPVSVLEESNDR